MALTQEEKNKRNESIDAVKGICLIHMLLLHLLIIKGSIDFNGNGAGLYFHLMEFFMIPFYVFSGYFFSVKGSFYDFVIHKAKKLIVPLFVWSLLSLPIFYVSIYLQKGEINWLEPLYQIISIGSPSSNGPLWFLFSLFCVNVVFFWITKKAKNEKSLLLFIMGCFAYSCIDRYYLLCFFSSSNISLGLVYFYIGYKLKNYHGEAQRWLYLVIALLMFTIISVFNPQWMQIVTLSQSEGLFTLNFIYSLSGTYILWFIFSRLKSIGLFSYFGRNSMPYYCWHMILLRFIYDPIVKSKLPYISDIEYVAMGGGIILLTGWILDKCAFKCCPSILGK